MEIHYGMKDGWRHEPNGHIRLDPLIWISEKGTVRDFRKLLKLCGGSDKLYGTQTISEWNDVLTAEPIRIRQEAKETARSYSRECEAVRKKYDDPGLPVEKKRKALREMDEELRAARRTFDTQMKHLAQALEKSQKLLEEVRAT